jgi:hypothetical protein
MRGEMHSFIGRLATFRSAFLVGMFATWGASAAEAATAIPALSGVWGRDVIRIEPPASGPGPVGRIERPRLVGRGNQQVADYTSPLLKPEAAELLKQRSERLLSGEIFPTPHDQCLPDSPLLALNIQIAMMLLQGKDRVTIVYLAGPVVRHIRLNDRHPANVTPSWTGDSVGHYEGDTLIVDTIGIKAGPLAVITLNGVPFSPAMHVVERYRLINGDLAKRAMDEHAKDNRANPDNFYGITMDPAYNGSGLQVEVTVDDPGIYTRTWSGKVTYSRPVGGFAEVICAENALPSYFGRDTLIPTAAIPDF